MQHQRQRITGQVGQGGVGVGHGQVQKRLARAQVAEQLARHLVVKRVAKAQQDIGPGLQCGGLGRRQQPGAGEARAQNRLCLLGGGFKRLPPAARHCQGQVGGVQRGEELQCKIRFPQGGVQAAAKYAAQPRVRRHRPARQQHREAQYLYLIAPGGKRPALVIRQGLRCDERGVDGLQKLPLPRVPARSRVIFVAGVGIQLPQQLFAADLRGFQRKGRAVGRADGAHRIKVKFCVQPFDLAAAVHRAAGVMQHQLAERRRHSRGVRGQPQQAQRHRAAGLGTVFQGAVHQPFVGKRQRVLAGPGGRRRGRGLAVPQL